MVPMPAAWKRRAAGLTPLTKVLGWLQIGKVPFLVLLVCFLAVFGLAGFVIQNLVQMLTGGLLPSVLAAIPALAIAVPSIRVIGGGLAKLIPKDESSAVASGSFHWAYRDDFKTIARQRFLRNLSLVLVLFLGIASILLVFIIRITKPLDFHQNKQKRNQTFQENLLLENQELQAALSKASSVLDSVAHGLLVTDQDGKIIHINPAISRYDGGWKLCDVGEKLYRI